MNPTGKDILMHYGMPKRSGRYPWGSGDNPYQNTGDFLSRIEELKKKGLSETEIAKDFGLSTTQYRAQKSLASAERRALKVETAKSLREDGLSLNQIAEKMGYTNDSSVRSLLNADSEMRMKKARETADILKSHIDGKGIIDIGKGTEAQLGVSKEKLEQAIHILEREGYPVYPRGLSQVTNNGRQTIMKVVCPPGTEHKDIYDYNKIHSIDESTINNVEMPSTFIYPKSMDSKRIAIRYAEDGGKDMDGVVELRRGVDDLSLGNSHYSQVRILVDGKKYIKGMALYSDDLPDGIDLRFNTNKGKDVPKENVFKSIKDDPDNPFGSYIKEIGGQSFYNDPNGKYVDPITGNRQSLSLINKRADEGDWDSWSNALSSQFLSKQPVSLIKKQLKLAEADRVEEFDEICTLVNPTIKKKLLKSFSDDCDAAAVHLKAAALPRQKYQVILPVSSLKDNEAYAPGFRDGETLALIRYPHGGTFEIPILKNNIKQADARRILGTDTKDCIGINSKVAERLSGADFDGDTVLVIPVGSKVRIVSTKALDGLKDFDAKIAYKIPEGNPNNVKPLKNTQLEMGKISNLITDMTLKGANEKEIARAVKHSMVVIDAAKHGLDYKQSERDNGIAALKKAYQGELGPDGKIHTGASTLISRAKSPEPVLKRKGNPNIDPETGEKSYSKAFTKYQKIKEVREEYVDPKTGKIKTRMQDSTKMAETSDARTLMSSLATKQEQAYAEYANKMKALANSARKEMLSTGKIKYSAAAKETYAPEVKSLLASLDVALRNAPKERRAQILANAEIAAKKKEYPDLTKSEIKKISQQALTKYRAQVGAKREKIEITDRQWDAIQAGAISENRLTQILDNTDIDKLRQRATPRSTETALSPAKINKIKQMQASGYTTMEIADSVGISKSTVYSHLE